MKFLLFIVFIVAIILAAAFSVIGFCSEKTADFCEWLRDILVAIMDAAFDKATLTK